MTACHAQPTTIQLKVAKNIRLLHHSKVPGCFKHACTVHYYTGFTNKMPAYQSGFVTHVEFLIGD